MRLKKAQRKAVKLSLNIELVEKARSFDLKLSGIAEKEIREAARIEATRRWQEENAEAIEAYHKLIEEEGLLSDHGPGWWSHEAPPRR